jgi:transcriptional regulator with XRE-family HTH domain
MNATDLGEMIKQRREQIGLSQPDAAEKASLSHGYLSRLERGLVPNPKLYDLIALSKALGIPLGELVLVLDPSGQDALLEDVLNDPELTVLFSQIGRGLKSKSLTDRERRLILNNLQVIADTLYADDE